MVINHLQKWNMLNIISCSNVSGSHAGPSFPPFYPDFCLPELYFLCDFLQIEDIVTLIQDETEGVPIRTVKSFMTKIPSVVTGKTLSPLSPPPCQALRNRIRIGRFSTHRKYHIQENWESGYMFSSGITNILIIKSEMLNY